MSTLTIEQAFDDWKARPSRDPLLALLATQQDRIFNLCFQVLRHQQDAEDASQDCLLKLVDGVRSLPDADQFGKWVSRVAINAGLDALRSRRAREEAARRKAEAMTDGGEATSVDVEALYEALGKLNEESRSLVVEHDLQKTTLAEIGRRLGIGAAGVLKRVRGAREELRRALTTGGMAAVAPRLDRILEGVQPVAAPPGLIGTAVAARAAAVAASGAGTVTTTGVAVMASAKSVSVVTVVVATLIGLGAGLSGLAVVHARDQRRIEELEARLVQPIHGGGQPVVASGGGGPESPADRELAKLRGSAASLAAENAELRAKLAASGTIDSVEDPEARVLALKATMPALIEAKDGAGMLKLMRELAAIGEAGYPAAMEIAIMLWPEDELWGLDGLEYYEGISGPAAVMAAWALRHPDRSPEEFRETVAHFLYQRPEIDAASAYLDGLLVEKDPRILHCLAFGLKLAGAKGFAARVAEAVIAHPSRADVLGPLLGSLVDLRTPEADRLLEGFALSQEPVLREEAEMALIRRRPPVTGAFIELLHDGDDSGLQRGDIITSYDGSPIAAREDLPARMRTTQEDRFVTVTLNRRGQTVNLQMKGGEHFVMLSEVKAGE